jgi:hypothetical protein
MILIHQFYYYTSIFQLNSIWSEDSHGGRQHIDGGWMDAQSFRYSFAGTPNHSTFNDPPTSLCVLEPFHRPHSSSCRETGTQETDHGHGSRSGFRSAECYVFLKRWHGHGHGHGIIPLEWRTQVPDSNSGGDYPRARY